MSVVHGSLLFGTSAQSSNLPSMVMLLLILSACTITTAISTIAIIAVVAMTQYARSCLLALMMMMMMITSQPHLLQLVTTASSLIKARENVGGPRDTGQNPRESAAGRQVAGAVLGDGSAARVMLDACAADG